MRHYSVIVNVPAVEIDMYIQAENEEVARALALEAVGNDMITCAVKSDFVAHKDPEVIESWELK